LADPDALSNYGLARADNAAFALAAAGEAGAPERTLVVDETLHGHESVPSLWRELFQFPLVLALVQGLFAVGAWLWAGLPRFGAPLAETAPLAAGKSVLIENTASLLGTGGHTAHVLARHFERTVQALARGSGPGDDDAGAFERLARLPQTARLGFDLG